MWQTILDWLPDLHVGTFEIRDLLNLVMTGLGAYLAYLAIKMGREQTRIGREQTEIAKRQEASDIEQGKIAKRQAEIAESQHQIMQEQLAKVPDVRINSGRQESGLGPETLIKIHAKNGGKRGAEGFNWEILIRPDLETLIRFVDTDGITIHPREFYTSQTEFYLAVEGHWHETVFPGEKVSLVDMYVNAASPATGDFSILWRIKYERGIVPEEGFTKITYHRAPNQLFDTEHGNPFA